MLNERAAAGAERHAFDVDVLRARQREPDVVPDRLCLGIANREAGDEGRSGQIPLEERWGDLEAVCDVIEAVAGRVGRQKRRDVNVEIEHIAHGVAVFGLVQTMNEVLTRIGIFGGVRIKRGRQPPREGIEARVVRPRRPLWRHRANLQAADNLFPQLEV